MTKNLLQSVTIVVFCFFCFSSSRIFSNRYKFARYSAPYESRFPLYITEPRVPCPESNTFVHPRNCSWFYRCNDPIVEGFYHRYYIECPVHTTFNSTHGICDMNHETNCNGIPYEYVAPPTTSGPIVVTSAPTDTISEHPSTQDSSTASLPSSPASSTASLPSSLASSTASLPTSPASSTTLPTTPIIVDISDVVEKECGDCFQNSNDCRDYTVCPAPFKNRKTLRMCSVAYESCPPCEQQTPLCSPDEYFSPFGQECYPSPTSASMACSYSVPCTFDGEIPELNFVKEKYCETYSRCLDNGVIEETELLCSRFVKCYHYPDRKHGPQWEVKFQSCPDDNTSSDVVYYDYSFQSESCVPLPDDICDDDLSFNPDKKSFR